jgi:DnaK suppressor protein
VTSNAPRFDKSYLDRKRRQLDELREEVLRTRQSQATEEANVNAEMNEEAHEYEDDAQKLATLELQGNLIARADARLADIERALRKIDEGSYGLSDASGQPIPIARLDAVPEALYTIEEQQARAQRASAQGTRGAAG